MLTDIFSALDPATNSFMTTQFTSTLMWLFNFLFIFLLSSSFWITPNRLSTLTSNVASTLYYQSTRTSGNLMKSFPSMISSLFIIIILMNLHGLIPYSFSITSHLIFTLTLGLSLWFAILLSSMMYKPMKFMGSLLPGGAPDWLNPALVIIETISIMVRPITLSFRLAANMSAGHIVLSLMGIYTASALFSSTLAASTLLITQMGYMMFEVGICLIQAYIFTLLLTLYADDHS
uniref:ATP synthase subunit a n=1 Tax=Clymenella torquata TaxID=292503 RepID=Q642W8_CLYTO